MNHEVICARFEDIASSLPADALLIADPPWGKGYKSNHNTRRTNGRGSWDRSCRDENFSPIAGDDEPYDPAPLLRFKVKVIFGANYFADKLPPATCWIAWDKKLGQPDDAADMELAWTNLKKPSRIFPHLWRGVVRVGEANVSRRGKFHPNEKPVELIRRIIRYTEHRGLVVDAYSGSGSTAVAAADLGLDCISVDLDLVWCAMTKRRPIGRTLPLPRGVPVRSEMAPIQGSLFPGVR